MSELLSRDNLKKTIYIVKLNYRNRFSGTRIGRVWAVLSPLLQMSLYTFVFGFVFSSSGGDTLSHVAWLICGYGPWIAISDGITTSSGALVANKSILKNFSVQTPSFPIAGAMMGLPTMGVVMVCVTIILFVSGTGMSLHALWVLFILPLMFLLIMGIGLIVSTLAVFIRDILQILGVFLMAIMFLTPIMYPIERLPGFAQQISLYNPFYIIVNMYRTIFIDKTNISFSGALCVLVEIALLWALGLWLHRKLSGYFESAL